MDEDRNNTFLKCISKNFNKIKSDFQRKIKSFGCEFNEDVFSDTLIKCNEKFVINGKQMEEEAILYFWKSFKNNTLRDLVYKKNTNITLEENLEEIIDEQNTNPTDTFDIVSQMIIDNFGKELYYLFLAHANGTTYDELIKQSGIEDLKYKFRCIREYVRTNYK